MGKALGEVGFELLKPLKGAPRDDTLDAVHELAERLRTTGSGALQIRACLGFAVWHAGPFLRVYGGSRSDCAPVSSLYSVRCPLPTSDGAGPAAARAAD